jgi:branched-chain amino acid transport system ATP-binding protein
VVVLHHCEKICEGAPEEVVRDPAVLECYLGEEAL